MLDRVVKWSREAGLQVVIDTHAAPGGQTGANIGDSWGHPWLHDSPEAQQLQITIWKRVAAHYRDSETVVGYDLLNQPIPHFPELKKYNPQLEPLYKRIVAAIREVDKNYIVILGGAQWKHEFFCLRPSVRCERDIHLPQVLDAARAKGNPAVRGFSRHTSRANLDERIWRQRRVDHAIS